MPPRDDPTAMPGIYQIRCIPTGKVYVGSSIDVRHRWGEHRSMLRLGKSPSRHLQHAWNKHGEAAFAFELLETVDPAQLIEREQHFIDTLGAANRQKGLNSRPLAHSNRGTKWTEEQRAKLRGRKLPAETRAKISAAGRGRPRSEKQKAATAKRNRERIWTEEVKAKHRVACGESIKKAHAASLAKPIADETRAKISAARRGKPLSPEHRAAIGAGLVGRRWSEESKAKLSASKTGKPIPKLRRPLPPEHRAKIAEANRRRNPDAYAKMAATRRGRPLSAEQRAAISAGLKRYYSDRREQRSACRQLPLCFPVDQTQYIN